MNEPWGETGPLRVRMGLHAGEAAAREGDYFGPTLNRTARIMSAGHGGQVLLSAAAAALVIDQLPDGAALQDMGEHQLKGLGRARARLPARPSRPPGRASRRWSLPRAAAAGCRSSRPRSWAGRRSWRRSRNASRTTSVRLLTLTGPGGIGKTRLSAPRRRRRDRPVRGRRLLRRPRHGARQRGGARPRSRARSAWTPRPPRPLLDELRDRLRDEHVLLILDNFEQVTAAAPTVARAAAGLPAPEGAGDKPRGAAPERRASVPGAAAVAAGRRRPPPSFGRAARRLRGDPALRRARAGGEAGLPAHGRKRRRRRRDLPAGWTACRWRSSSPPRGSTSSRRRPCSSGSTASLQLLRSGPRDLPERQQTLRAAIEWSYELLEPGEQRLFELLAAFSGATFDAVEAVAATLNGRIGRVDTLDGLASLVDKSLVRQAGSNGDSRLRDAGDDQGVRDGAPPRRARISMPPPAARTPPTSPTSRAGSGRAHERRPAATRRSPR